MTLLLDMDVEWECLNGRLGTPQTGQAAAQADFKKSPLLVASNVQKIHRDVLSRKVPKEPALYQKFIDYLAEGTTLLKAGPVCE